jgi:hypothetical protein
MRLGEEVLENGPFQGQVIVEEVMKEVFGDHVEWKSVI